MESMPLGAVSMSACFLSHRPDSLTSYSSWVLLSSHALWVHLNSVLMGHPECYVQVGLQRMVVPLSSAHVRAPSSHQTSLTKHSSKDKIVRNFKEAITEH